MTSSDFALVQDIEALIADHLKAMKHEAHQRILKLESVDRDKAWEEISASVDAYGKDMLTDATYWLKQQVTDYASRRWHAARGIAATPREPRG